MSTISASTTTTTAFKITTDTTGALVFQTGSSPTTALTIDGAQNMGLGVTPSPWGSSREAFQIGTTGAVEGAVSGELVGLVSNAYINAANNAYLYTTTNSASRYFQNGGQHAWQTAASGTAGTTATFTQTMTLNASGNLGVGVTSIASDAKVHVGGALRAGSTTYNASPFSTLFANTLAASPGFNRVVNFDGNGASSASVWWTNGTRAYGAIDADATNNLSFYANNGSTWQKQANINYGSIDLLTTVTTSAAVNATGGVMTVSNPVGSNYNENLRLPRAGGVNYTAVAMACDPASSSGAIDGQFTFLVYPSSQSNGQFSIRHNTTDVFVIQKSGYITTPLNPAFEAKGDSGAVLSNANNWQKVPYSQSVTQRGTAYSSGSSRFTAPIAGWYQFNAQWSANNNADIDGTFTFAINGVVGGNKGTVSMPNTGGDYDGHSLAATMYLALNDYVEVQRYSTVSTTSRVNDWQGWFSGHFIG
jgi:hypothetical protein